MLRDFSPTFDRRSHRLARRLNAPTMPADLDEATDPETADPTHAVAASAQDLQGPALSRHLNRLRFPTPLEAAFHQAHLPSRRQHALLCTIVGVLSLLLGLRTDQSLMPDLAPTLLWVRIALTSGLTVSALWAWLSPGMTHHKLETLVTAQVLTVAGFILWMAQAGSTITAITHSVSLFLVPIFSAVVMFQRFHHTVLVCLVCMLSYPWLVHARTPEEALILGENLKLVWIAGSLSMLANYVFERHERHVFWLRQQSLHQRLQLESLKRRLKRQSTLDALTGLHNRRHFDESLHHWSQASHRPLSLLMIDVDHFKAYNDQHGHPAGDKCLRVVAGVLADHAKRLNGLAARVGGEEFAILLPHCSVDQALFMGQALCAAVRGEGLTHAAPGAGPVVTISVGVSGLSPHDAHGAHELYAQADAALYQAKGLGRNQCVQANAQLIRLTTERGVRPSRPPGQAEQERGRQTAAHQRPEETELALIEKTLAQPAHRLRLPRPLQISYEQTQRKGRQRHLMLMGALGLAAYALMTLQASALMPDIRDAFGQLRQGTMGALTLAILSLALPMPARFREWLFAACASALSVSTLYMLSHSQASTVYSYVVAIALIPAFSAIGARQSPTVAWLPAVSTVAAMLAWTHSDTLAHQPIARDSITLVIHAAVLTLFGSFTLEHRHRQSFLLRRKDQLQTAVLKRMSDELQRLALTDALTGINNRRQFVLDLDAAWEQALQTKTPLALMIIDIDCFKAYNDRLGHAQGDLCLRQVAQAIAREARLVHGLPARLGGEEFAVVLSGESAALALACAQQLCQAIEDLKLPHHGSLVSSVVTISVGVAMAEPHLNPLANTELLAQADEALYDAKTQGRNRAVLLKTLD